MSTTLSPLKRFFNLLKIQRQDLANIYVYALFSGLISLSLPLGIQAIINLLGSGQVSSSWVILVVVVIVGVAFTGILQIMQLNITERIQRRIFTHSAFEFAYRLPRIQLEAVSHVYIPEMVNRFFDTLSVQKGLSKIIMDFSSASLQIVFGLILLSIYHPFFILFSLFLLVVVYLIFRFTAAKGLRTSLSESKQKYEVAYWLEELARTMETFRLAGKSDLPMEKTNELVDKYLEARQSHFKTLLVQFINLVGFKVLIAAGLLIIGGLLVLNQQMNIGQFVAAEIIIITVLSSVEKLILSMETIYDVLTSIEKIGYVTDIPLERQTGTSINMEECNGLSVEAKNLGYHFPDKIKPALKGINIQVPAGSKLCISGYPESGKTTLLQTLSGLFVNYEGHLKFNELPLGNLNLEDLRSWIGDNLAREELFRGTILENITLNKPDISFDEVRKMTELLGLSPFIENSPQGFNTIVQSEGQNLPKQVRIKMMLARCLTGNPRLVLLEENFNFLQQRERENLIDYLVSRQWTVIAVSNLPSVARHFDQILVLKDGEPIHAGNWQDLQNKSWFNEIFDVAC